MYLELLIIQIYLSKDKHIIKILIENTLVKHNVNRNFVIFLINLLLRQKSLGHMLLNIVYHLISIIPFISY